MKQKGFILIGMLFMMVFIAVTAVALNRRAGLQSRIAGNQVKSVQTYLDRRAPFEYAVWRLTKDPSRRSVRAHRYLDLTFEATGGRDDVYTAGGNFFTDGFVDEQGIDIVFSFPYNDANTTITDSVEAEPNHIEMSNNTVTNAGAGTGVLIETSNRFTNWELTFSNSNQITLPAYENFSTRGFSQYDKILITESNPPNDGVYTILNDVSATPQTIIVASGSILNGGGGSGNAAFAKLTSYTETYTYNNVTYTYDMLNSTIPGYMDAVEVTVTIPGVADPVKAAYRYHIDTVTTSGEPDLNRPHKIAMDSSGNIYVADKENHRIHKIDTAGNLTTVAGTGTQGFSGDDGPAVAATLNKPEGVALDSAGNIYIADTDNCRIRKVTVSTGIISRVAGLEGGAGACGWDGDGVATSQALDKPRGVFIDASGNIYIADTDNHRIRKVTGVNMTTVAGDGTGDYTGDDGDATLAGLNKPRSVFLDTVGFMYIADKDNNVIRRVDTAGTITTVAGNYTAGANYTGDTGPATRATLDSPEDVFVDSVGNLFIADSDNHVVRMVNAHDGIITTLAGIGGSSGSTGDGGPAVLGKLNKPSGVTMASVRGGSAIYISDRDNSKIRVLTFEPVGDFY